MEAIIKRRRLIINIIDNARLEFVERRSLEIMFASHAVTIAFPATTKTLAKPLNHILKLINIQTHI